MTLIARPVVALETIYFHNTTRIRLTNPGIYVDFRLSFDACLRRLRVHDDTRSFTCGAFIPWPSGGDDWGDASIARAWLDTSDDSGVLSEVQRLALDFLF